MVIVGGGTFDVSEDVLQSWRERADAKLWTWKQLFQKARKVYGTWRAVLEGDVTSPSFVVKEEEVAQTRKVLQTGTVYRGAQARAAGLGPQETQYVLRERPDEEDEESAGSPTPTEGG
jgi:hypothetical protein